MAHLVVAGPILKLCPLLCGPNLNGQRSAESSFERIALRPEAIKQRKIRVRTLSPKGHRQVISNRSEKAKQARVCGMHYYRQQVGRNIVRISRTHNIVFGWDALEEDVNRISHICKNAWKANLNNSIAGMMSILI